MLKLWLMRALVAAGWGRALWRLWREHRPKPALPEAQAPQGLPKYYPPPPALHGQLFDIEQAWHARQSAWARLCREQHGPYKARAFAEWRRACVKTEQLADAAAGDASGRWRKVVCAVRRL